MGLFDRNKPGTGTPPPKVRPMTAAGARIDLAAPQPAMIRRHRWQEESWGYRNSVPEMWFAMDFVGDAMGRMRLFPAENRPRGQDPIPFGSGDSTISQRTQAIAQEFVQRIGLDSRGNVLTGRAGVNIDVAGECFLLGRPSVGGGEDWSIRSVSEVRIQGDRIQLVEPGKSSGGEELEAGQCELIRLWKPDPQYYDWPDSGMSANLEYAEELKLYSRLIRSTVRSRLSSGGIFYLPQEFSLTRPGGAPVHAQQDGGADEDDDLFMEEFIAGAVNPISDESDPSAVVPMVLRGPAMIDGKPAKDLVGVVEMPRQDPEKLQAQREAATRAFARGIKLPPEILTGLGDVNHWSGWVIDSTTCKNYIEPRVEVVVDAFTVAALRAYLRAAQCPPDEIARSILWYDPREIVENPNRGQDAKDAHTAGVLSDEKLAEYLGFGKEDMPTVRERIFRAIEKRAISDQQLPVMLAAAGLPPNDPLVVAAVRAARAGVAQGPAQVAGPKVIDAAPEPPAGRDNPVPDQKTPRTASAEPAREPLLRVDEHLCRQLAEIDPALVTRLVALAEGTVGRAVEKAATRIKARAQRDPELAAAFRGAEQVAVVASLGRDRLAAFAEDDDVQDAIAAFRPVFIDNLANAAENVANAVGRLLRLAPDRALADRLSAAAGRVWPWLAERLSRLALSVLYDGHEPTRRGETSPGVVPVSILRGAIAQAAGLPEGSSGVDDEGRIRDSRGRAEPVPGLASGREVRDTMAEAGAAELGFEWNYYGIMRTPFHPHLQLSGARFMSFTDPELESRPQDLGWIGPYYSAGDHKGCLCSNLVIWATPRDPGEARALADAVAVVESARMREERELLLEGPDGDDANPGRGVLPGGQTYAQRARDVREELLALRTKHILDRETQ